MLTRNNCFQFILISIFFGFTSACTFASKNISKIEPISFCTITSNPDQFDHERISVDGSVSAGPEGSVIIVTSGCKRGMYFSVKNASDAFIAAHLDELIFPPEFPEKRPVINVHASGHVRYFPEIDRIWLIVDELKILD